MVNQQSSEGALRCPTCNIAPAPKLTQDIQGRDAWELRCEQHGHVAMGDTVEQAVSHWNKYVWFIRTGEVTQ